MRILLVFLVLVLHVAAGLAAEADRPTGTNCKLEAPPEAAGEESNHGMAIRIYPRARDIDFNYTGCQAMWARYRDNWALVSLVAIEGGDPIRIWSSDRSSLEAQACRYRKGQVVVGNADNCPAHEFLIAKSLAPGCTEQIRKKVAEGGLGAPWPAGCSYE